MSSLDSVLPWNMHVCTWINLRFYLASCNSSPITRSPPISVRVATGVRLITLIKSTLIVSCLILQWNPYVSNLQRKRIWFKKIEEFEKSGIKWHCLSAERETTFGFHCIMSFSVNFSRLLKQFEVGNLIYYTPIKRFDTILSIKETQYTLMGWFVPLTEIFENNLWHPDWCLDHAFNVTSPFL